MIYLILLAGLAVCWYALVSLRREKLVQSPPAFREILAAGVLPAEADLYQELKEQLEAGLEHIKKQQSQVENLLLRMEERLQAGAYCAGPACSGPQVQKPGGQSDTAKLREEVRLLHGRGATITKIASNTGLGKGEVELILSLKS